MAQRQRNMLAFLGERTRHAMRNLVDLVGDEIADRGDIVRQIEMDAGDGVTHLFGLRHQRFALVGQFAEQIADAHFVVVVGALERGDFIVHQCFQLGGARQRPLDAVAHGGDLAPDGLADRNDRLVRGGLRLRQPHRHLSHRFRDQSQILRTAENVRENEEENGRQEDRACDAEQCGKAGARRRKHSLQFRLEQQDGSDSGGNPEHGGGGADEIGQAGAAAVQGLQNLPDAGTVVIGGPARRAVVGHPVAGRAGVVGKHIGRAKAVVVPGGIARLRL